MNELRFNTAADLHAHYAAVLARTRGPLPQRRATPVLALLPAASDIEAGALPDSDGPGLMEGIAAPIDMLRTRGCKFLISYVSAKTGVSVDEIVGPIQSGAVVAARHMAMAVCVTHTRQSISRIGDALNRDHTTVSYVIAKYKLKRPI